MCYLCDNDNPWTEKLDWLVEEMKSCLRPELSLSTQRNYIRKRVSDPIVIFYNEIENKNSVLLQSLPVEKLLLCAYLLRRIEVVAGKCSDIWAYTFHGEERIAKELMKRGINIYRGLNAFIAYDIRGKEEATFIRATLDELGTDMSKYKNDGITWSVTSADDGNGICTIHAGKGVVPDYIHGLDLCEPIEYVHPKVFTVQ